MIFRDADGITDPAELARRVIGDKETEARILAGMIVEDGVLELCAILELADLFDPRHRAILWAIRSLQKTGRSVDVLAVSDEIEMRDVEHGSHVSDHAGVAFIGGLVCDFRSYSSWLLVNTDLTWLRTLTARRAA